MEEGIAKELPVFLSTITTLKKQIADSNAHVKSLTKKVSQEAEDTDRSDGLSFLEMKVHLVLEYLINLTYTMLLKMDGHSLDGQPCIQRLVEIRTVLEKIRPINKKLTYQIDKLIKLATTDLSKGELHPLSFKPNLANLASKDEADDGGGDNENNDVDADGRGTTEQQQGVYVPPKVTAVPYDEDNLSKKEKRMEKARQRSLNSTLLQDLRSEYGEAPDEIIDDRKGQRREKFKKREDERKRYEEDNMRRLTLTKNDKLLKRKMNELDEVIKLGSFHGAGGDDGGGDSGDSDSAMYKPKSKKKGKFPGKAKKFKKKMQKRRK